MRLMMMMLALIGVYPQFRAVTTILIAGGRVSGDWVDYMNKSKVLVLIEPVTEGIMQLFCQTVILGIKNIIMNNLYPQHSTMKLDAHSATLLIT